MRRAVKPATRPAINTWQIEGARKPAWIGRLRAVASGALINKGLAGRVPGDALNTRASGHLFLEIHLRSRPRVFPILSLSERCSETRADKDFKAGALKPV